MASRRPTIAATSAVENPSRSFKTRIVRYSTGTRSQDELDLLRQLGPEPRVGVGQVEPRAPPSVARAVDRERPGGGVVAAEQVETEVHADPEQPGAEPPRRVEAVEPVIHLPERLLRQVARQFLVADQAGQDPDELPLVPGDQGGEGPVVAGAGEFDQAGVSRLGGRLRGGAVRLGVTPGERIGVPPRTDSEDFRIA